MSVSEAVREGQQATVEPEAAKQTTGYVILHQKEDGRVWEHVGGPYTATNKEAAINAHLDTLPLGEGARKGRWKAVSVSAWRGGMEVEEITEPRTKKSEIKD